MNVFVNEFHLAGPNAAIASFFEVFASKPGIASFNSLTGFGTFEALSSPSAFLGPRHLVSSDARTRPSTADTKKPPPRMKSEFGLIGKEEISARAWTCPVGPSVLR